MTTEDQKLHPCAFFSWRLSPAERNYDIGNNKLLAVTLVLEDWRHWLGGTKQLFLVWTDQKNLEYVRKAKRLNSKCLVVLFPHHWPGSHNIKYDALSHQYLRDEDMVSILSISHLIAPLRWEIEERVKAAQEGQPGPSACPKKQLFVPPSLQLDVLQWAHNSRLTCHPGFWWDSLNEDTRGLPHLQLH